MLCSIILIKNYKILNHEIKKRLLLGRKATTNLDSILKSRDITLPIKVRIVKSYNFSSSHVRMWELKHKEGRAPENWCFWIVILEKTPESSLDSVEIKGVNPERNQPWIHWRLDGKTEAPVLWPPNVKSQLIWKDPNVGKDWRQKKKGVAEDKMVW